MTITLKGELREAKAKLASVRAQGFIPAVFYGHKQAATPCVFQMNEFKKVLKAAGESTIVTLEMPTGKVNALITEVQYDPVKGEPIHADFSVIEKGHEVTVHVPVEFIGVAPAVKDLGATLVKALHEIEVKALPENLPHGFTVDVSSLATLDGQITAGDVVLPKGVTLVTHASEVVAAIAVAKEEPETPVVMDLASIEVEKKGKKEEEEPAAE